LICIASLNLAFSLLKFAQVDPYSDWIHVRNAATHPTRTVLIRSAWTQDFSITVGFFVAGSGGGSALPLRAYDKWIL